MTSRVAQVVLLKWEETGEEHKLKLYDIQPDSSGRLAWAAVEEAFGADLVEISDEGTPGLLQVGDRAGLTIDTFQPGDTILVNVSRKAQAQTAAEVASGYFGKNKYGVLGLAPSSAASFENYNELQKLRINAPFFLSGRPASAKAPPLALVHEVFGEFLTDADSIQPSPDTFDFVLEACAMLADFYADEKIRQQLFNRLLGRFLGKDIYSVSLTEGVSATGGSIVDSLDKPEFASLHVEYKEDMSTGTASDPSAEIMSYHYCLLNRMAPKSRLASSPCFGVVVIGCMLWICGLAFVGKLAFQPLTPMFPMLDLRPGQPAYMEQLARAFEALRHGVTRLGKEYAASPLGVRPAHFVPYPLTNSARWLEVQHLVNIDSLLFFARDAQTETAKVIKYVTKYSTEVHQALSDTGLAPVLYDTVQLKGGFMQVEMELLAEEDGWTRLDMMSAEELSRVQPAVLAALDRVHALRLPDGGSVVLADCRPCNVMVRIVDGGLVDVRFIDFDWAGRAGVVRYPCFMNHRDVPWPDGVKEFEHALQIHDTRLLTRHLPKMSTAAVHKLPAMQRPRHSLWRCGILRFPHAGLSERRQQQVHASTACLLNTKTGRS